MTISPREVQVFLKNAGYYNGEVDGILGRQSQAAMLLCLQAASPTFRVRKDVASHPERYRLATEQLMMASCSPPLYTLGVDGLAGPATHYGYTLWDAGDWRNPLMDPQDDDVRVITDWPAQRDLEKFYGPAGKNLARLTPPFPLRIAWDLAQVVTTIAIHEKVIESASRVFDRVLDHYGLDKIIVLGLDMYGGCLANPPRPMRGGTMPSTHNWAIAIDFDPEHNQLRWDHTRAKMARPDYVKFWQLWEEEGWLSLGRARDFDWMHVQAARIG